jgi:predicted membrane metal-binding protein
MKLDDAKEAWQSADDASETSLSDEALLSLVKEEAEAFDEKIRRRDRREIIAAAVVFLFFSVMLFDPSWMVRAGAIVVMAGSVWIVWTLRRTRSRESPSSERPVAEVIRTERAKVDRQIRLLETVLWWYIGPPALGLSLVVAGDVGLSWFTLVYGLGGVGFFGYVYYLNQRTVRNDFRPRRRKLTRLLRRLDDA